MAMNEPLDLRSTICIVGIVKNINNIVSACLALSVCLHVNILNLASQSLYASALAEVSGPWLARLKHPRHSIGNRQQST